MSRPIQEGEQFGRLTVIRFAFKRRGHTFYLCQCVCSRPIEVRKDALLEGRTTSCGCLKREQIGELNRTHGMSGKTPEHQAWAHMVRRCHTPTTRGYGHYGGRGIKVCDRWRYSFANFLADMGLRPSPDHSLDRIDNDGDYEPGNCRWTLITIQANNTRRNRRLEYGGKSLTVGEWTRELGYPREVIRRRIKEGWPVEDALLTPPTIAHGKRMAKRLREAGIIK